MFGLEKKSRALLEFDLEKELKSDPLKAQQLLKDADARMQALKATLRRGASAQEFEACGVLLQGYAALHRVLQRIVRKKL